MAGIAMGHAPAGVRSAPEIGSAFLIPQIKLISFEGLANGAEMTCSRNLVDGARMASDISILNSIMIVCGGKAVDYLRFLGFDLHHQYAF